LASSAPLELSTVLYAFLHVLKRWPRSLSQLKHYAKKFSSLEDLESYLKRNSRDFGGTAKSIGDTPSWVINGMSQELGRDAAWLAVPGVRWIMLKSTALGWTEAKTQAALETTAWWKTRNEQQRAWKRLLPGEREQLLSSTAAKVYAELRRIYGVDYVKKKGWTLSSDYVKGMAHRIASGATDFDVWALRVQLKAERISGTPANSSLLNEQRAAGEAEVAIEDLAGQLGDMWREWMGTQVPVDEHTINRWAKDIYANKSSREDFRKFIQQQSTSMYPNKPENVSYAAYVAPAKQLIGQLLELGDIGDDDALVQSYAQGQVPSLADLRTRLMQDARLGKTEWWKQQQRQVGTALTQAMGF
jgi:hypothetical protein